MNEAFTKAARSDYETTLYRAGCAIKAELKPSLDQFVKLSGARSFSGLIAILAAEPERSAAAVQTIVREATERAAAADPKAAERSKLRRLAILTKGLTPAELEAAVAAARAQKAE